MTQNQWVKKLVMQGWDKAKAKEYVADYCKKMCANINSYASKQASK